MLLSVVCLPHRALLFVYTKYEVVRCEFSIAILSASTRSSVLEIHSERHQSDPFKSPELNSFADQTD